MRNILARIQASPYAENPAARMQLHLLLDKAFDALMYVQTGHIEEDRKKREREIRDLVRDITVGLLGVEPELPRI